MKREYGSEFWDIPVCEAENMLIPQDAVWMQSGRSALSLLAEKLVREHHVQSVMLPSWCCDSMITPFLTAGIRTSFYDVFPEDDGTWVQDYSGVHACDAVLIMSYFGYSASCRRPENYHGIVIRDLTHGIFSDDPRDADYYFGSLRKWAAFAAGGFAFAEKTALIPDTGTTRDDAYLERRRSAFAEKKAYISGETDSKDYLGVFRMLESQLDQNGVNLGDPADRFTAAHLDLAYLRSRRRDNAELLLGTVGDMAVFPAPEEKDCPLFVPVLVPDGRRDELRIWLIQHRIYCPVHWPVSEYHRLNDRTRILYDAELSLICDQRYDAEDIKYMCEVIKDFYA